MVASALCGTGATHRMGEKAPKVMVTTALDLIERPEIFEMAREEFDRRREKRLETLLVPSGLSPPMDLQWPEWVARPGAEWWIPP